MSAILSIDGRVVLHRLGTKPADAHDPCVWICDTPTGGMENMWHSYYADEVVLLLQDLAAINLAEAEAVEKVGAITHESRRVHEMMMRGKTDTPEVYGYPREYELNWEIGFGNHWETFPCMEVLARIEWGRVRLEPGQSMPIHPDEAWPADGLLKYLEGCKAHPLFPPHMLVPITIIR